MEQETVAEVVARDAAIILDRMGLKATPHYIRPGLWDLLNCVYIRDPLADPRKPIRLVDVCIRDDRFTADEIAEGHSFTAGLIWQASQPFGYSERLDKESRGELALSACRAVFEVLLSRTLKKLETFSFYWMQEQAA